MKTTQSLTNKIMQLEKKYWQAMAGPNGMHSVDRATYGKMFNSGVESFALSNSTELQKFDF